MPIYEYECTACAHNFEAIQRMSDAPLVDCPACAKPQLRKKLSAAAFHLKGSGWYQTDFKGGNKPPASEGEGGATPEAKDTKGEAKVSASDSKIGADINKDSSGEKASTGKEGTSEPKPSPPKTPDSSAA